MSTIRCQAKDPATCSFHRPNAGKVELVKFTAAKQELAAAKKAVNENPNDPVTNNHARYLDAQYALGEAEDAYYATPAGLEDLRNQMNNTDDASELRQLLSRVELAEWQVAAAEKQNEIDNAAGGPLIPAGESTYKVPSATHGGNELWPETVGGKYDSTLKTRDIATKLSQDYKQAQKEGYLPKHVKFKVSPNSSRRRIKVTIIGASDEQIYEERENNNGMTVYNSKALELRSRADAMLDVYNKKQYDEIEGRTNMTKYWSHIEFETDWDKSRRLEREAKSAAKREAKRNS